VNRIGRTLGLGRPGRPAPGERRYESLVLLAFGVTGVCGLGLLVVYALGGQTQVEGVLLFGALAGIGTGIVLWGQHLMAARVHVEARDPLGGDPATIADIEEALVEEAGFSRRRLLILGLGGALASLAAALAIPIFSLGPAPGRSLFVTSWRPGRRLAPEGGDPIRAADVPIGSVVTVFPDGDATDPNSATLLIRVGPREPATSQPPAPEGSAEAPPPGDEFVVVSKICTHAGCPVGLYRSAQHVLICPSHQSEFDVLDGAKPINGPAVRPLPPLPFRLEADGTFTALGDFPEPVGPSFWDMQL
jgi:ubiquinol-cytochrome c reductase iron-sulfur subunit